MDLRDLYQEVIIDHNRNPRNFHDMPDASSNADGFNPLCGDKLSVFLKIKDDTIQEASFTGCGCAISTASASLMTEILKKKSIHEAHSLFKKFHDLMTVENFMEKANTEDIGKLAVLAGVRIFPSRIKCATLAWHTLEAALANEHQPVSTE
jgi:nitrogen fixation protein NifU and related proteins